MGILSPPIRTLLFNSKLRDPLYRAAGQRPAFDIRFFNQTTVDVIGGITPTFTRPSSTKLVWNGSQFVSVAADVPAFQFNSTTGLWEYLGEPAATNFLLRNTELDNAVWSNQSTAPTVTANQLAAPDGQVTADRITFAAADSRRVQGGLSVTSGTTYTISVYARSVGATLNQFRLAFFDGVNQTNSSDFVASSASWTRFTHTFTSTATSSNASFQIRNAINSAANDLYLWGVQIETGSTATSPIITAGSAITRAADSMSVISGIFGAGTYYADFISPAVGTRGILSANDNTANERIELITSGTDPLLNVVDGNVSQASVDGGAITAFARTKIAATVGANNFSISVNGGAPVTDNSGTMPTVDRLLIGQDQAGNRITGALTRLMYFAPSVADSRIQQLSAA